MIIKKYPQDVIRKAISLVEHEYEDSKKILIPFDAWRKIKNENLMSNPERNDINLIKPGKVRYASVDFLLSNLEKRQGELDILDDKIAEDLTNSAQYLEEKEKLLKEIFVPEKEFDYKGYTEIKGVPCWFASASKSVYTHIGPKDLDMQQPSGIIFNNDVVHANIQGITGCGKSVTMHDLITNMTDEYPPWEVRLKLIDAKGAEFHFYYASGILPHADVVSASESVDFMSNIIFFLKNENKRRQNLCRCAGVQNIRGIRNKFNLIIPIEMLIVDEIAYLKSIIMQSESLGNRYASETMDDINSSLADLATTSRNVGIHMILSSQELDKTLKDNVMNQMQAGMVMKCTSSMSTSALNNKEANTIVDRKGMGVINCNRTLDGNSDYNKIVGIPFIEMIDEKTGKDAYGKFLLSEKIEAVKQFGLTFKTTIYDDNAKVPYSQFVAECEKQSERIDNDLVLIAPLGKPISITDNRIRCLELRRKKGQTVLMDARDPSNLAYIINCVKKGFELTNPKCNIKLVYKNVDTLEALNINKTFEPQNIMCYNTYKEAIPRVFNASMCLVRVDRILKSNNSNYNLGDVICALVEVLSRTGFDFKKIKNKLQSKDLYIDNEKQITESFLDEFVPELSGPEKTLVKDYANNIRTKAKDIREFLNSYSSRCDVIFWLDLQDADDIKDLIGMKDYLDNSTQLGFFNLINCSRWDKMSRLTDFVAYDLNYSTASYYSDMGLGRYYCNTNKNSITYHDVQRGTNTPLKIFGGI